MSECRFSYTPIVGRPKLQMPNGCRIAIWVGVNIEFFDLNEPIGTAAGKSADPLSPSGYGWYQYGVRVGVFRIMDMLSKHGLRGSVLLNSDVCEAYPAIIEEGNKRDWVWLAHGKRNRISSRRFTDVDDERVFLTQMLDAIKLGTGKTPLGWLGPGLSESINTPDILAELGLTYVCDWVADDQPFPLKVRSGRMINVPYAIDGVNDNRLRGVGFSGNDYYELIVDQFDQLYADGIDNPRVMCLAIHPHVTGQPFRAKNFDRALSYITSHKDVWLATSDEIAEWYYTTAYVPPT